MNNLEGNKALADFLQNYSTEVTTPDRSSLDGAARLLPPRTAVYIASLPKDPLKRQVETAMQVREFGMEPVPHLVARNFASVAALDELVRCLTSEAGVNRVLLVGGDRDKPEGEFDCSQQLLQSGVLQKYNIQKVALGSYPEGHPRIDQQTLDQALLDKIQICRESNFDTRIITQLCFNAETTISFIRSLRERGISEPVRIGLTGPTKRSTLIKYAMICGVGNSLRAVRERQDLAKNLLDKETPFALLKDLATANQDDPSLNLIGAHFFTFSSLKSTIGWIEEQKRAAGSIATDACEFAG